MRLVSSSHGALAQELTATVASRSTCISRIPSASQLASANSSVEQAVNPLRSSMWQQLHKAVHFVVLALLAGCVFFQSRSGKVGLDQSIEPLGPWHRIPVQR